MGDSIWKHGEKRDNFFFWIFDQKSKKKIDILVVKNIFLTLFLLFLTTFRIF